MTPIHSTFPRRYLAGFLTLALLSGAQLASAGMLTLENPGFEDQLTSWRVTEKDAPMSTLVTKAAHSGSFGLKIEDNDSALGSSVESAPLPVTPGTSYKVTFFAKADSDNTGCGVYLKFRDAARQNAPDLPVTVIPGDATEWTQYEVEAVAPPDAADLSIWIHSFSKNVGVWMIDDLTLEEIGTPGGAALPAPPIKQPASSALPEPRVPVVLKVDDLIAQGNGTVPPRWQRIVDLAKERKFKLSIGLIANSLEGEKPVYHDWLKECQQTGLVEFWFHGYTHKEHTVDGMTYAEFSLRTYEEQKELFAKSQKLAEERLGAPFTIYGPPGGGNTPASPADWDATARVLAEDPAMKMWLYPIALDIRGRKVEAEGKVTVLDRVYQVNIEQPLFAPNSQAFAAAYGKFAAGRKYYIIQGHPNQWDDARWAEFVKIIDFLQENNIPIVTASDLAGALGKS